MGVLSRISYPVQKRIITALLVLGGVAILTNILYVSSGETHFWSSSTNWVSSKVADGLERVEPIVEGIWNHDEQYNVEMSDGHPIAKLIRKAEAMQYLEDEKRSKTLEEAVKHYKEKWGRLPPPGFDKVCCSLFIPLICRYPVFKCRDILGTLTGSGRVPVLLRGQVPPIRKAVVLHDEQVTDSMV
jgi:hypothetical protein